MTKIEWTEKTWNPIAGCTAKSEGCTNCYAMSMAHRLQAMGLDKYQGLTRKSGNRIVWTGKFNFDEKALLEPLKRKKPTTYFVNSMSDLFHDNVPDEWIDKIFAVMALCPQHTFQVLTKRPERMKKYFEDEWRFALIEGSSHSIYEEITGSDGSFDIAVHDIPNVWLGVSVEDQKTANERIPLLLDTPAAIRWVSAEPLLGAVDLNILADDGWNWDSLSGIRTNSLEHEVETPKLDWVVAGGESGPRARPMHIDWVRSIQQQCEHAQVPFMFKQYGEWLPYNFDGTRSDWMILDTDGGLDVPDGRLPDEEKGELAVVRVGKKKAGRELDGKIYDQYPSKGE